VKQKENKMKVLISGSSRTQATGYMSLRPIACLSSYMYSALVEGGHTVLMCLPHVADLDVIKPDILLLGLSPASGLTAQFSFQCYDLYRRAKLAHVPVVWFVDDKAINQIPSHMGSWLMDYEKRVNALCGTGRRFGTAEYAMSVKDTTLQLFEAFLAGQFPEPIMIAMWGPEQKDPRTEKYFFGNRTIYIDPSSTIADVEPLGTGIKQRQWMIANLGNYGYEWINKQFGGYTKFTWPIISFGKINKVQQPRATQPDMLNVYYPQSWGVMSPTYPMSVGRLYRTRFVHNALNKSIILSTHKDTVDYFGPAYAADPKEVESMKDFQLQERAEWQAKVFWSKTWTKTQFIYGLNKMLLEATE